MRNIFLIVLGEVLVTAQKKGISYEYIYNSSGLLEKAIITDFDGNVKTLDM